MLTYIYTWVEPLMTNRRDLFRIYFSLSDFRRIRFGHENPGCTGFQPVIANNKRFHLSTEDTLRI